MRPREDVGIWKRKQLILAGIFAGSLASVISVCGLAWVLGGGREVQEEVMRVQAKALADADKQVTAWGIEHNDQGERADVPAAPAGRCRSVPEPSGQHGHRRFEIGLDRVQKLRAQGAVDDAVVVGERQRQHQPRPELLAVPDRLHRVPRDAEDRDLG